MESLEQKLELLEIGDTRETVASLKQVTQRYRSVLALDGVDLDIPSRKMIGLIGPDGVGKSTLLGIIAGVRRIQTGKRIQSADQHKKKNQAWYRVQHVYKTHHS